MASQYRVLFAGGVLEGHDKAVVKKAAAARLKLSSAQVDTIFSGQKIILKKGLDAEEASRYGSALEKIGMRIRVQKVVTEAVVAPANTDSAIPALEPWPPVDANLPKGGIGQRTTAAPAPTPEPEEYDPEKTHIYNPAALAQHYVEPKPVPAPAPVAAPRPTVNLPPTVAQNAPPVRVEVPPPVVKTPVEPPPEPVVDESSPPPPVVVSMAEEARDNASTRTVPRNDAQTTETAEDPALLGSGFEGRLGRVGFLIGSLVVKAAAILIVLIASFLGRTGLICALVIAGLPGLYFLVRLAALRSHDLGINGRLSVLVLIPGLNVLAFLYWIFFPGNSQANRYGLPGSTAGAVPVLITLAVFAAIVTGAVLTFPRDLLPF